MNSETYKMVVEFSNEKARNAWAELTIASFKYPTLLSIELDPERKFIYEKEGSDEQI